MPCPTCERGRLKSAMVTERIDAAGITFAAELPARVCRACGEELVESADLRRLELAAARWLAESGRCTPDAFRFMRKALGLRAVDAATLLGVSAYTISRWETGERTIDGRSFALLGGVVADRIEGREDTRARLDALRAKPRVLPSEVRVRVA